MVKDGIKEGLLSVDANYLSFADRIFNKYKDLYTQHNEEAASKPGEIYCTILRKNIYHVGTYINVLYYVIRTESCILNSYIISRDSKNNWFRLRK